MYCCQPALMNLFVEEKIHLSLFMFLNTCFLSPRIHFFLCRCKARECRPDLYLPFDDFADHAQGNWVDRRGARIRNVAGAVGGLAAYFDGSSSVVVPRFANYDFQQNVYITLRYLSDGPSQTGRPEALVTNADCEHSPSIALYHDSQVQSSGGLVRTPGEYNSTIQYPASLLIEAVADVFTFK